MKLLQATMGFLGLALMISTNVIAGEIHRAAWEGNLARVKLLLKNNPKLINQKDAEGDTPLIEALTPYFTLSNDNEKKKKEAWPKKLEVAKFLIENGADVNASAPAHEGKTALHLAAQWGEKEIAELLISKGAKVDAMMTRGGEETTPLGLCLPDHTLYQFNSPDEEQNRRKREELEQKNNRRFLVARLLIENGANVHATKGSESLLDVCLSQNDTRFADLLLNSGAVKTKQGVTEQGVTEQEVIDAYTTNSPTLQLLCSHGGKKYHDGWYCRNVP